MASIITGAKKCHTVSGINYNSIIQHSIHIRILRPETNFINSELLISHSVSHIFIHHNIINLTLMQTTTSFPCIPLYCYLFVFEPCIPRYLLHIMIIKFILNAVMYGNNVDYLCTKVDPNSPYIGCWWRPRNYLY